MGAGAASALADVSDGVAAVYVLARDAGEAAQVAVAGGDAAAVVDDYGASVAAQEVGKHDHPVGRRHYRLPVGGSDINTTVEGAFSVERVNALAKRSCDGSFHRPKIRGGIRPQPVGRGRIAGQTQRNSGHGSAIQRRGFERAQLV